MLFFQPFHTQLKINKMVTIREFEVGEHMLKDVCPVCKKKLKLGEKIVLVQIQAVKKGFGNAICLPTHTKCYWVDKD